MTEEKPVYEVLTIDEAAAYLRVTERTVRVMLKEGRLPGAKIGRAWRVRRSDLDRMLAGQVKLGQE